MFELIMRVVFGIDDVWLCEVVLCMLVLMCDARWVVLMIAFGYECGWCVFYCMCAFVEWMLDEEIVCCRMMFGGDDILF